MLLLVHGLGATGRVWDGWRSLLDERWPGRWLAPDLAGHAGAGTLADYSFGTLTAALAERLDPAQPHVVLGHSLGGVVGLELGSGRVDTVFGLGIKVAWSADELAKAQALARRPVSWFDSKAAAAERFLRVSGLTGLVEPDHESVDSGLIERDGRWRLAVDPAVFGVGAPDMPALITACTADGGTDVVLVRGERDPMNTDSELAALHTNVVTLPRLGHNAHVEDPAAVLRLVTAHAIPASRV